MIRIKTKDEIDIMAEGGRRLTGILKRLAKEVRVGGSAKDIDDLANQLAAEVGDKPTFLGYKPEGARKVYRSSTCISVNDEIVHGIPRKDKIFREGDVVTIDMGLTHRGLITDSAITLIVGRGDKEARKLVETTKIALKRGIEAIRPGGNIGDVGYAIEEFVKPFGFGHAEGLAGHGVGYELHEDPYVPNTGRRGTGPVLKPGMVIAIEPMLNEGAGKVVLDKDGYTIRTKDGGRSAHFEHTVAITERGYRILTAE